MVVRIKRPSSKPKNIIKRFRREKLECIAIFKNGMIYDYFLKKYKGTDLRHKIRGKKEGALLYKGFLGAAGIPEEVIKNTKRSAGW